MSITDLIRKIVREREAIPSFDAIVYSATVSRVLRRPESKIANDVASRMSSGTVLDIGSGPGYLLVDIAAMTSSLRLLGIDLSRRMVRMARRRSEKLENVRFVFGDAARLPFRDDSVDLVISTGALHHWRQPAKAFHECYRVLRTGAEAWIYDGCPDVFEDRVHKARLRAEYGFLIPLAGRRVAALNGFSRQEYETGIRDILAGTGFRDSCRMDLTDVWMKITLKKRG